MLNEIVLDLSCCQQCQQQPVRPLVTQWHGMCGRSIVTDEYLCVKGSKGTIYALGDAATVEQPKALDRAKVAPKTVCSYSAQGFL